MRLHARIFANICVYYPAVMYYLITKLRRLCIRSNIFQCCSVAFPQADVLQHAYVDLQIKHPKMVYTYRIYEHAKI